MKILLTKHLDKNYLVMPDYVVIKPEEIPNYDRGELSSLILNDYIDYCKEPIQVLIDLASLVGHGGSLQVSGLNLRKVARDLSDRIIGVEEAAALVYRSIPGGEAVRNATDIHVVVKTLESRGFKIIEKTLEGNFYNVVAQRV